MLRRRDLLVACILTVPFSGNVRGDLCDGKNEPAIILIFQSFVLIVLLAVRGLALDLCHSTPAALCCWRSTDGLTHGDSFVRRRRSLS